MSIAIDKFYIEVGGTVQPQLWIRKNNCLPTKEISWIINYTIKEFLIWCCFPTYHTSTFVPIWVPLWETIYFPMLNAQYPSLVDQSNEKVKKLVQISMFLKIKIVLKKWLNHSVNWTHEQKSSHSIKSKHVIDIY